MEKTTLYNPTYSTLSGDEQVKLLHQIAEHTGTTLIKTQEFSRFGRSTFTGIFRHPDSPGTEFVFVPGAKVRLGWDGFKNSQSLTMWIDLAAWLITEEGLLSEEDFDEEDCDEDFSEAFEEMARKISQDEDVQQKITTLFKEQTTDLGVFEIGPMLVERHVNSSCWCDIPSDEVDDRVDVRDAIQQALAMGVDTFTVPGKLEIIRDDSTGRWRVQECVQPTFAQLKQHVEDSGFFLPTLREWKYLAGGGCETLAVWGDSLDYDYFLQATDDPGDDMFSPDSLKYPNFFGLTIGFDPYRREVVTTENGFAFKGGDAGEYCCGGADFPLAVAFPTSPYFVSTPEEGENPHEAYDFYRRIIRIDG